MNASDLVVMGLIHHEDSARTISQKNQSALISEELLRAGVDVVTMEEFRQEPQDPANQSFLGIRVAVFRRLWAQEIHHLREIRRRRGSQLAVPIRKRRQAFRRVLSVVKDRDSLFHAFRRLEIEAALSLKHFRIWNEVRNSRAIGAIILEDDFYFRGESGPTDLVSLVHSESRRYDLIDLAGGLTRDSLGLLGGERQDVSLPFLVANTTCGYFISKRACKALVELVSADKELLYLAPDFLITELNITQFKGSTLLPYDLPLVHGSRDGTVESSIPY